MELWEPKLRIERTYRKSLDKLFRKTLELFRKCDSVEEFRHLMQRWSETKEFGIYAESLANKMVTGLFDDIGNTWRQAARHNSRSREIYNLLMRNMTPARRAAIDQLIFENSELIKTLPDTTAQNVADVVRRQTLAGRRADEIGKDIIKMFPKRTEARANLIARTEVAKTHTALIQTDCQDIGANWYFWHATHDKRCRASHRLMDGVLCNWNDPPNPEKLFPGTQKPYGTYAPGCTFNCRCYPEPLVHPSQITGTCKVHRSGSIVRMTRAQVLRLI